MKALVLGGGGREHALARGLADSPSVTEVLCGPGNPGTASFAENVVVAADDPVAVADLADARDVDLVVVGPEQPLVNGVVDAVTSRGRLAFGPVAAGARLEGSKAWMKEVLVAAGVPTAAHRTFGAGDEAAALAFLATLPGFYVVKTDGLAAGKGVVVTESLDEARDAVRSYLSGDAFGDAGRTLVVRRASPAPSCRCSSSATAIPTVRGRSLRPRTSSGSATVTPVPTRGAWVPTRPSRSSTPASSTVSCATPSARPCANSPSGGSSTAACSTRG